LRVLPALAVRSVIPEILEPLRRELGVADGVHDVLVAEIVLQGARVVPACSVCAPLLPQDQVHPTLRNEFVLVGAFKAGAKLFADHVARRI
jgi:hypothetical protein